MKSTGNSDFPVLCPPPGSVSCQASTTALPVGTSPKATAWAAQQSCLSITDKARVSGWLPEALGPDLSVHASTPGSLSHRIPSAYARTLVQPALDPPPELCGETEAL